jgi:hypothetical protein
VYRECLPLAWRSLSQLFSSFSSYEVSKLVGLSERFGVTNKIRMSDKGYRVGWSCRIL